MARKVIGNIPAGQSETMAQDLIFIRWFHNQLLWSPCPVKSKEKGRHSRARLICFFASGGLAGGQDFA